MLLLEIKKYVVMQKNIILMIAMMTTDTIEKSYAIEARYCKFYSGGDIVWSNDGQWMYCINDADLNKVDVTTGLVRRVYNLHIEDTNFSGTEDVIEDTIFAFALSFNDKYLLSAHRSSLLRLWNSDNGKVEKLWKSQHKSPMVKVCFSADSRLVCSSGSDSTLRIWDYIHSRCICVLKEYNGPSTLVQFHTNPLKIEIVATGSDNSLYIWNYEKKNLNYQLKGHLSQITGFAFQPNTTYLSSVGRDKVLIVWCLEKGVQIKVIVLFEELEGLFYINNHEVIIANKNGCLELVDTYSGKISNLGKCQEVCIQVQGLLHNEKTRQLAVITSEHNILIMTFDKMKDIGNSLKINKQLVGFNDEVLDICFLGETERFLAVATNSKDIKLYNIDDNMNCKIVSKHTDTVMTLSTPGTSDMLLSAGKDFSIILWQLNASESTLAYLTRILSSHTATIGCISFALGSTTLFASVCQKGSLKVWTLKYNQHNDYTFHVNFAVVAHKKEINCVTFSPNNKLIATASQDKTAKIWSVESQSSIGTLHGHTRSVWCVRFSPIDQIILTTSSDCSLRIWGLANLTCLKRLEQSCSVLKAEFLEHGKYIISAGSDGLLKLWSIKSNACIQTLDEHENRVWALAVSKRSSKNFISGASDSQIIKWYDITENVQNNNINKRQSLLQQEQILQNLLNENSNLKQAFALALKLGKPRVTNKIIQQCLRSPETKQLIASMIDSLDDNEQRSLMDHLKIWSTNSRYAHMSNVTIKYLLSSVLIQQAKRYSYDTNNFVKALIPYAQRYFKRITELKKELNFLEYIVQNI